MNILYIRHKKANSILFVDKIFKKINCNVKIIRLEDFISSNEDFQTYDFIFYQTWPDNNIYKETVTYDYNNLPIVKHIKVSKQELKYNNGYFNHQKFKLDKIEKSDLKFLKLNNKHKILIDLFDDGDEDAYSRFLNEDYPYKSIEIKDILKSLDSNYFYNIPRIKLQPSNSYLNKFNVILETTYFVKNLHNLNIENESAANIPGGSVNEKGFGGKNRKYRNVEFHYNCYYWNNPIRIAIKQAVEYINNKYQYYVVNTKKFKNYDSELRYVFTNINAPGCGPGCIRHIESFNNGCLLLAYNDIKNINIIPYCKLIDGEDYILFNLNNFEEKIRFIINNPEKVNRIRINGHEKFKKFYNFNKISEILLEKLKKLKIN